MPNTEYDINELDADLVTQVTLLAQLDSIDTDAVTEAWLAGIDPDVLPIVASWVG